MARTVEQWLDDLPAAWREDFRKASRVFERNAWGNHYEVSLANAVGICCDWNRTMAKREGCMDLYCALRYGYRLPKHPSRLWRARVFLRGLVKRH